jgi:hypothetical protein
MCKSPEPKTQKKMAPIFYFESVDGPFRHSISWSIITSDDAAVKFGTSQVSYGSIIMENRKTLSGPNNLWMFGPPRG